MDLSNILKKAEAKLASAPQKIWQYDQLPDFAKKYIDERFLFYDKTKQLKIAAIEKINNFSLDGDMPFYQKRKKEYIDQIESDFEVYLREIINKCTDFLNNNFSLNVGFDYEEKRRIKTKEDFLRIYYSNGEIVDINSQRVTNILTWAKKELTSIKSFKAPKIKIAGAYAKSYGGGIDTYYNSRTLYKLFDLLCHFEGTIWEGKAITEMFIGKYDIITDEMVIQTFQKVTAVKFDLSANCYLTFKDEATRQQFLNMIDYKINK